MTIRHHLIPLTTIAALFVLSQANSVSAQTLGACCNWVFENFVSCQNNVDAAACEFDQASEGDTAGPEGSTCGAGDQSIYNSVSECLADLILLPVELTSFESTVVGTDVVLEWTTASETNNAGFSVEQEVGSNLFSEVAFVEGNGTTDDHARYTFTVADPGPGLHRFRLKQIDFDGTFDYSSVVEAAVAVPDQFLIEPAYPNPFNPTTTLRFAVAKEQHVEVTLVNAAGQSVGVLYSGTVAANEMQRLTVDASALPSGTYLVHFEGVGISTSERIVLAK